MSLINYVEPVSVGDIFIGAGSLILAITLAVIFYRLYGKLCEWVDLIINKEAKYSILEEDCIQKIATERNIDLDAELRKRHMLEAPSKNFRRKIEDKVFDEMFPESEPKNPKSK